MALLIVFTVISALATYELAKLKYFDSIMASSAVGICSYLICNTLGAPDSSLVLYGASFVGMTSSEVINRKQILISALIYFFIFSQLKVFFEGHGGLLGMSAFIAVTFLNLFSRKLNMAS